VRSFTPWCLYPGSYFSMRLGGSQTRSGCFGEEWNLFHLPGFDVRFLGRPSRGLVTIVTELPRPSCTMRYHSYFFQHFVAWYLSFMFLWGVSSVSAQNKYHYYYYYYYYYYRISHFSAVAGNFHLSWDIIINRIRLDGLIYNLKRFLQLNMFQELQIFEFVCTYSDAG